MTFRPNARAIALAAVVLLGLSIRLPRLGERTITHPELYMPGIELPDYVRHPMPRTTLVGTLRSVYYPSDIHPPGFYVGALGWTRLFGTSLFALRLLAVLGGTATIAILGLLAWRTDGAVVAVAASLGLALHGFHITKSIQAQLWVWPAFWAVLTVWLLHGLLERTDKRKALIYLAALTLGLWTEYSFWLFAAVQVTYVAVRASRSPRAPFLLKLQAQAVVLALPVFLYLRKDLTYANRGYLDNNPLAYLPGALGFGYVTADGVIPRWFGQGLLAEVAPWLLAAFGLALLLAGLRVHSDAPAGPPPDDDFGALLWPAVAALNALVLLGYSRILATGWKLPLLLAVAGLLAAGLWKPAARFVWPPLSHLLRAVARAPVAGRFFGDIVVCHGLGFIIATLIAGTFTAMLEERVLLAATPFLLVVFARGWREIGTRGGPTVRWVIAALALGALAFTSYDAQTRPLTNRDYRAVAEGLASRIQPGDLVVTRYAWYSAPLHYYLRPDRYEFIRLQDFPSRLRAETRRAWLIVYGLPEEEQPRAEVTSFERTLGSGFEPFDGFAALGVRVLGYRRAPQPAAQPD